jgi:hypothetical protein
MHASPVLDDQPDTTQMEHKKVQEIGRQTDVGFQTFLTVFNFQPE